MYVRLMVFAAMLKNIIRQLPLLRTHLWILTVFKRLHKYYLIYLSLYGGFFSFNKFCIIFKYNESTSYSVLHLLINPIYMYMTSQLQYKTALVSHWENRMMTMEWFKSRCIYELNIKLQWKFPVLVLIYLAEGEHPLFE